VGEQAHIYADSRAMLRDRVTAPRTANIYERQSYRHIVGLPVLGATGTDGIRPELVAEVSRSRCTGSAGSASPG
jgi:3-phenylpropionate/cinnamic acid dioxygenase small subunit